MKKEPSLTDELMRKPLARLREDRDNAAIGLPSRLNRDKLILQTDDALALYTRVLVEELDKATRARRHKVPEIRLFMAHCIAVGRLEHELAGHRAKFQHWEWTDAQWDAYHHDQLTAFKSEKSSKP